MARSAGEGKLKRFRKMLAEGGVLTDEQSAITELEHDAERLATLYLGKSNRLRPSMAAREFRAMAKGLRRATQAASKLGEDGLSALFALSLAYRDADNLDLKQHIDYLERLATYADRAAEAYADETESAQDDKGGRAPDQNLRDLVMILMDRFQELLSVRPSHTVDKETGLGVSLFDIFAKEAIARFAPEGVEVEPRKIDDAIAWSLPSRDFEAFTPPRLPEP